MNILLSGLTMSERLWAPWRYDYVSSHNEEGDGCIFCRIAESESSKNRENLVLYRGTYAYAILNGFPYINGHLMVIPYRHVADLASLKKEEIAEMMDLLVRAEKALKEGMNCQGLNGGWNIGTAGGAGIPGHLHMHLLPRWNGDTNFMSTVGAIRVVSQSLESSYKILVEYFGGSIG